MRRLRELREKRGLTLEQVADALGLRNQYVSNYELGKRRPDFETLSKFADFYHVSVDYLLERDSPGEKTPAAPENGDGRPYEEVQLLRWFSSLPPEKRQAILALGDAPEELRAYLERERSDKST